MCACWRRQQLTEEKLKILLVDLAIGVQVLGFRTLHPLVECWNCRGNFTRRRRSSWRSRGRGLCSGWSCAWRSRSRRLRSAGGSCPRRHLPWWLSAGRLLAWGSLTGRLLTGWLASRRRLTCGRLFSTIWRLRLPEEQLIVLLIDLAVCVQVFGLWTLHPLIECRNR